MTERNVPLTKHVDDDQELARLMAGLPGMVYRANAEVPFAFEIVGGGYERIFGRSAADLVGKPEIIGQTQHPDDVARYVETVTDAVERRESFHVEYHLIQPDGTERAVWEQGCPVVLSDGRLVIEGSIVDIDEPTRAHQVQEATYRISQAAASTESLQELYSDIHHIIAGLMPSENLFLALRDPESGFITYPYYIDEYDVVPPDPQTAETGLTAYILRDRDPASPELLRRIRTDQIGKPDPHRNASHQLAWRSTEAEGDTNRGYRRSGLPRNLPLHGTGPGCPVFRRRPDRSRYRPSTCCSLHSGKRTPLPIALRRRPRRPLGRGLL